MKPTTMEPANYTRVLTIAGSDSGGGAGIQADLKTFAALGCYGTSVLTAVTAQNTVEVKSVYELHLSCIEDQLNAVLDDVGCDAVKIGMLHSKEVIMLVAKSLRQHRVKNIVLDPVMLAKSGDRLLQSDAIQALKDCLFPLATIITPNLPESSDLLGRSIVTKDSMEDAAKELLALGPESVVIKGGHLKDEEPSDCLVLRDGLQTKTQWFHAPRLSTQNTHGTGCTLSSAIAANLAQSKSIPEAVQSAKVYLTKAIAAGAHYCLGRGHGPVHHFFQLWS